MSSVISWDRLREATRTNVIISENGEPALPEEWDYEPVIEEEFDEALAMKKAQDVIGVSPSQFVEFSIRVREPKTQQLIPFSFDQRRYLRLPYDVSSKRTLYKCGRQVEKSTLLGNKCISYAAIHSSFSILYVSPTNAQTKVFSQDRLKEPIDTSDILKAWTTSKLADNVFLKKFVNRSQITLRYAYHNADRVRGIPSDMILIDEIQDIITDNIPVIEESASHSEFKVFIYAGTPKSYDNTLERYWSDHSTQNEWAIPCEHHGVPKDPSSWHWNVLGEQHIGKDGLICDRCGNRINPMHMRSQWVSMNPRVRKELKEPYEGFRIPQLMVPWLPWGDILDKYRTYARDKFFNEVLGLSYDSGTRPLRREDVIQNCRSGFFMNEDTLKRVRSIIGQANPVWAGIDWGTGTEHSFTVLSLGTYLNDRFFIFYIHRFEGPESEPVIQLQLIEDILKYWNVQSVGTDYGGGVHQNNQLMRSLGKNKVWPYQYSTPSQKVRWEPLLHHFLVHRTEVMKDIFEAIKRGNVFGFPDWQQFEKPFGQDFLNIFSEYVETQRMIRYDAPPDKTDDSFHSLLYCFLVSMITHPRYDILNPTSETRSVD